jgi:hypothetical protein
MTKNEQIKGMANPNRGSVGVQEAQPPQRTEQSGWRKKQIDNAEEEAWRELEKKNG